MCWQGAVLMVAEVPRRFGCYGLVAAAAVHGAGSNFRLPVCAGASMMCVVAALGAAASFDVASAVAVGTASAGVGGERSCGAWAVVADAGPLTGHQYSRRAERRNDSTNARSAISRRIMSGFPLAFR